MQIYVAILTKKKEVLKMALGSSEGKLPAKLRATGAAKPALAPAREPAQSLSEKAYIDLEELIVTMQLPPGSAVSEVGLSTRLGIGRTPIRERCTGSRANGWSQSCRSAESSFRRLTWAASSKCLNCGASWNV